MSPHAVAARILAFNHGRRPDTLLLKFAKLRRSRFDFFRGTDHLFFQYARLPESLAGPLTGLTGDLHLENFGAYRGADGQVCFSVNDFDEALLGPAAWDLARFVASLHVGLADLNRPHHEAKALAEAFLDDYRHALAGGDTSPDGPWGDTIGAIVAGFPHPSTTKFLDEFTQLSGSGRVLTTDNKRFLALDAAERARATELVAAFAGQSGAQPLRVQDVARLVAGTSSLGLDRYVVLAEDASGEILLELKEVRASCAGPYLNCRQADWPSQAARVVAAQRRFQAVPPARLGWVGDESKSFVVRDYARTRDRMSLDDPQLGRRDLSASVDAMAQITAGGHLRGSAAPGAAGQTALQAFAHEKHWGHVLLDFAHSAAEQSQHDYEDYCTAFDHGELSVP
jgi:uncharacterized protein (DUF2252 family)